MRTEKTFCRMCPALCGVLVDVDEGTVRKVSGDNGHLLSKGYTCPKGRKMGALVDDPHRLDRPMMRNRAGELVPVGWDEALDDLAGRLTDIRQRHDGYAIGGYMGTIMDTPGAAYLGRLLGALGSPSLYTSATVDAIAKVLIPKLMSGRERLSPSIDFDQTTLMIVIGENMVVSHGGFSYFPDPVRSLRRVVDRGEVWVLDPRRTETARLATRHLTPRSGTDFAVLAHLIRELLLEGADHEYLAAHARQLDELTHSVQPFDREFTAALTGLAATDLEALLATVRRHRRLAIVTGTGVTMTATANVTEWMTFALQIVTGSFERPGGRWFNHTAAMDPDQNLGPDSASFEPGPRTWPEMRRFAGQYPCAVMPAEIEGGHLRALLVAAGNPLVAFPQPERMERALGQLDVLAVWDIVGTPTVARATHVFPCPSALERADFAAPRFLSAVYAQYTRPVVPPRAERRAMWWSISSLAHRMGIDLLPGGVDPDECSDEEAIQAVVAGSPIDWDELADAGGAPVEYPRRERWVERHVLPEGRWNLAPAPLVERLGHALQRPVADLVLGNRREVHHTNSLFTWEQSVGKTPQPFVYASPADAEAASVADGDRVEVASMHGTVVGVLRVDESMAPGTLVVPNGFAAVNVGHLSALDVDVDPLTGMPTLVGVAVTLRLADPVGSAP